MSCSADSQLNTDEFKKIPDDFSVNFFDKLDTIRNSYDKNFFTRSLSKELTNNNDINYNKPINLNIINDELFLKFEDNKSKTLVIKFYGKRFKNRFVFYSRYETISFPVLFITKSMEKFIVYFANNNEIIVKKFHDNEGMVLFLGAGNSFDVQYKFKIIKK